MTFISEPFAVRTSPIRVRVGKKSETTGYNYFCSFAAAVALGPVDRIDAIYMDDELVWEGPLSRDVEDFVDITIAARGTVRFYWGTEAQTADPVLAASGQTHPPYRWVCYLVFSDLFLGANRNSVPNIEVVAGRRPTPTWMTAEAAPNGDANLIAVFWDLWTNPRYGLGLSEDRLDTAALDLVAATLVTEDLAVSPVILMTEGFRQALAELLENVDA